MYVPQSYRSRPVFGALFSCLISQSYASAAELSTETIEVNNVQPDRLVGSYKQPEWSAHRLFVGSRTYVIPKNTIEAEFWVKAHTYKDGSPNDYLVQQEIEWGFADHLQFDFYVNEVNAIVDGERKTEFEGTQWELRWALDDWGVIPWNPTFYFEYHPRKDKPEKAEVRLLLAESIAPQWMASANIGFESELWGEDEEHEIVATLAVGTTALSRAVSLGAEVKNEWVDVAANRGHYQVETMVGPSVQWRPSAGVHIDLAPLFGVQKDAPRTETWLIVGSDLN